MNLVLAKQLRAEGKHAEARDVLVALALRVLMTLSFNMRPPASMTSWAKRLPQLRTIVRHFLGRFPRNIFAVPTLAWGARIVRSAGTPRQRRPYGRAWSVFPRRTR